jgi:signal transduction histidine kinase
VNRQVFIQVAGPALAIGVVLLGACVASVWYINRLRTNLATVLSQNVVSLQAAQELEILVRQLRFHWLLYLSNPLPSRLDRIENDNRSFEAALVKAEQSAQTSEQKTSVREIDAAFRKYSHELDLARLRTAAPLPSPAEFGKLADSHPVNHVVDPCRRLLDVSKATMERTQHESERVSHQANRAMVLLGLGGPLAGLIIGYGVARALSRSIYRLSVQVHDISQRLDQDVASVKIAADGDLRQLDAQLQHVVRRVEEVAERSRRQQREMIRAEQLSAVGQLAAGVAHEVRNPLTGIKLLVEAARRPDQRMALTPEDLEVMHGEIARLEQTVQGFLDLARPPCPERSAWDLREVVNRAVELVKGRARQTGVDIRVTVPEQSLTALVDQSQLTKVLVNLLLNALDVLPHGGRVEVELQEASAGGARIAIRDNGPGISSAIADRLFTPFVSTKPTGTGLGLSISRRIIEEHGGRLSGHNRPEGGAMFLIELPPEIAVAPAKSGEEE